MPSVFLRAVLTAFAGLLLAFPPAPKTAEAAVEYFPVPAVSTSKNDGSEAGLIVPFLISTPEGELRYLVAPLLIRNSIVGVKGAINVFAYGARGQAVKFIASAAEEIERRLTLSYADPAFGQGRFSLGFDGGLVKNATSRFYGFSQNSQEANESNYTNEEIRARWYLGVRLDDVTQIGVAQRYRDMTVLRGATDLPFTLAVFPGVDGGDGARILGNRAFFLYDTRDNLLSPTDGMTVAAYAELNWNFDNESQSPYYRYVFDIKKLFPSRSKRAILVMRANLQTTFGDGIPFYERSALGGQDNLRGYGESRFIDKQLLAFNFEQRLHILRTRIFNVFADFEFAPFVDIGRVFNTFKDLQLFDSFEVTPGVGFRGLVRPNVVGRVDVGVSREGTAVFAGLDYPF